MEEQQLWDLLRALGRWGQPLTHWALVPHTGSFGGHLFSWFWFGSPPSTTGESFPMKMAGAAGAIESESPGPEDSWEALVTCGAEQSSSFSS